MNKKLGIVNASPYYIDTKGDFYMQPSELKSLEMFDFFKEVILYKPRKYDVVIPDGWVKVSDVFKFRELCNVDQSRLQRKKNVRTNIKRYLNEVDLFYFRMPNYVASWAWEIIRETTKPFFTELHGDWAEAIISEDGNSLLRKITREYRAKRASSIVEKMVNESSFILTIGHKLTKYIKEGSKPVLITTNHLLDEKYYVKLNKQISGNSVFKILFVGDIQVRKGLLYLFKAVKRLLDQDINVQLNMVGSGASETTLKTYVNENKMNENVVFHGRVPHGPLLFEYFKKSNVFVLPSVGAEGVPRVIHEAMAMSCPVIATDVGSVAWQMKNDSGILVPAGDEHSIFTAINNLIKDPVKYNALVKAGYVRSLEFTYEKQKEQIKQFILGQLNE